MATLKLDPRNGMWLVRFRFDGQQFQRSCRTTRKAAAVRVLAAVEDAVELLNTGRLAVPECEDLGKWILSGGKSNGGKKAQRTPAARFGAVCDAYFADQKQKAPATLHQETTHLGHLKRLLKPHTPLSAITLQLLKRYSEKRSNEKFRGKHVSSKTIRKELTTFRQIWIWAQRNGRIERTCPLLGPDGRWEVHLEKPKQALKFQTWSQIERRIARGGITETEISELWRSLFLDESEVSELLEYVKENASHAFQYAMFVFAAYTGARRSEICRSQIDDFDLEQNQVLIRERKRRKNFSGTARFVPYIPS